MITSRKKIKFGEQYIRYLFSYMTILLIPLIILTFFYSSRFMKKFYEEIYETVDLELIQTSTLLENELNSMQSIVEQIALTGKIRTADSAISPLDLNPIISYLSGFSSSSSFIEDIALIMDEKDYIVTSTTTSKKDYYFNRFFQMSDETSETLQQSLKNSTSPFCLPRQKFLGADQHIVADDIILFSYPVFTDYQKHEGTVLFYVRSSSIQTLLSQKLQSYHAQIYITDQTGDVVITSGDEDKMSSVLNQITKQNLEETKEIKIDNKEYVVRSHQSDNNQWSYVAFIPNKQSTFSQVSSITRDYLLAIVIILFICSFAIYFLQKINYGPVRRLQDKAKQIFPESSSRDELTAISNALDYLSDQNSSLSSKLADNLNAIQKERLYRLLNGNYQTRNDFNLDCSELDLYLPTSYFSICIFMVHSVTSDIDKLAEIIKEQIQIPYNYYYLHNLQPNQIIILLNLPTKSERPHAYFQQTQEYLRKQYNLITTIGIGSNTDSTEKIALSYMEAVSALDYRFVKGNGTIIDVREVMDSKHVKVVYPNQEFESLRNALLSHKEQNIRAAIQTIIHFMEERQLPLYLARSICYDLIHLVNEHCRGPKQTTGNSPLELSGIETAQEIIHMLYNWSENLSGLSGSTTIKVKIKEVIAYVDKNCLNCNFSAYESAEQFEMTLPAFSKYFKENTGQNIMDYTINLRINKSKDLLESTNLTLKQIGEQVGYYNLSSFTRRFKLHQGITPSEFRKIATKQPK